MYRLTSRIFTIAAVAVVMLSGCAESPSGPSTVATGKPDKVWYYRNVTASEFTIYNADELAGLAQLVNDDGILFEGRTITLGSNISLARYYGETYNDGKGWIPIGTYDNPFRGVFDGNGKVIGGLYFDCNVMGLFGYIWGGTVRNLGLEGVNDGRKCYSPSFNPGRIVVYLDLSGLGIIDNCYVTGNIYGSYVEWRS